MLLLLEDSWNRVRDVLRDRVGDGAFDSWLATLRPVLLERGTVYLEAESRLAGDRVRALYRQTICEVLSKDFGTDLKVEIQARETDHFAALEVSPQRPVIDESNHTAFLLLQSLIEGGSRGVIVRPAAPAAGDSAGRDPAGRDPAGRDPAGRTADSGASASASPATEQRLSPPPQSPPPQSPQPLSSPPPPAAGNRLYAVRGVPSVPTNLHVFYGPSGVGKTFLLRWWRELMPLRAMWFDMPALLKAFQAAHRPQQGPDAPRGRTAIRESRMARVNSLRDELAADLPLVLDEAHRIAKKPGLQKFVLEVLQLREAHSSPTIFSSRWHPKEIRELDTGLSTRLVAGFVCGISRPGPMARLRYLRALEGSPSRNGRASQVESLAQKVVGSYPELRAAWAAQRGHSLPKRYLELIDPSRVFQRTKDRVADKFGVSATDLIGKGQGRSLSRARKVLARLCQEQGLSGGEIGRYLERTRAAVSYMLKSLEKDLQNNDDLRQLYEDLA
ncbi:MAG: DnaA N-terminal domain-containing protein [Planctomycetota bacterium]